MNIDNRIKIDSKRIRQALVIIVLVVFIFLCFYLSDYILEAVSDPVKFKTWISESGLKGILCFIGLNMTQVFLTFIPSGPFSVAAGYVFGPFKGTLLCISASTVASAIVFFLVKKFGRSLVSVFVSEEHLKIIDEYESNEDNEKRIERFLILIFVIPGTPKDVITYLAGLTKISFWKWILISLIGRFPGAYISALGGSAFESGKALLLIATLGGVLFLFIIGKLLKKVLSI